MNIETLIADANPVPPDRLPLARSERGLRVLADVWASATEARPGRRLGRDPGRPARPVTRRLMPSIALAGALAVGVAAVITTQAGPGSRPARPTPGVQAETAAYVLARAAAAQANTRNMISEQQDFINGVLGGSGTTWTDVATQQERVDSAERASSGLPYFQMTTAIKGGVYTNTTIENQHHAPVAHVDFLDLAGVDVPRQHCVAAVIVCGRCEPGGTTRAHDIAVAVLDVRPL